MSFVRPTFSKSLCFPPARTHFCEVTALREVGGFSIPVKIFLNCTIPALVKSKESSFVGTRGEEEIIS